MSSAPDALEARITELEIKASFTDDLVESLNATVYRQQQQIDFLIREIRTLREQMQSDQPGEPLSLRDELPPHY